MFVEEYRWFLGGLSLNQSSHVIFPIKKGISGMLWSDADPVVRRMGHFETA